VRSARERILDIGCGPEMMIPGLIKGNFEYYGVDISQDMIFECKRQFGGTGFIVKDKRL
jgi:SAM-dependent methyltransferase